MKKTISILLIVTMLLSMFLVAVPVGAEEVGETYESVTTDTWTGEHKTEQQIESEVGEDFTVITNYADFDAITSGTADAWKYYCLVLPEGEEVLTLSGKTHLDGTYLENIYIDFNGYTVDVSGVNNALFNTLNKATLKNLKMIGTIYARSASWTGAGYDYKCEEIGMSPVVTGHLTKGTAAGVYILDNIVSDVDMVISAQHGGGKQFGGIISQATAGSQITNCVYTGSMVIETDTTDPKVGKAQVGRIGGIAASAEGTVFDNCRVSGSMTFDDDMFFGTDGNSKANVGGLVGHASGETVFTRCENNMDITVNAFARKSASVDDVAVQPANIGGIAGTATGITYFEECANLGDIKATAGQNRIGGIVGNAEGNGVELEYCFNYGTMSLATGGAVGTYGNNTMGLGGIVGIANESIVVEDCHNKGAITVADGATFGSSAFGAAGVVGTIIVPSEIDGCTNDGPITYYPEGAGEANSVGGIVGKLYTQSEEAVIIKDCVNKANGVIDAYGEPLRVGGIVGGVRLSAVAISDCENLATISGSFTLSDSSVGGIVGNIQQDGDAYATTIDSCSNSGDLTVNSEENRRTYMGGMVGKSYNSGAITITNCDNTGNILGDDESRTFGYEYDMAGAGGIMGDFDEAKAGYTLTIKNCTNSGLVRDTNGVAGILGAIHRSNGATVVIEDCKNNGAVSNIASDSQYTASGGILGIVNDWAKGSVTVTVSRCINMGNVTAKYNFVGGIVGGSNTGHSSKDNHPSGEKDLVTVTDCLNCGALTITTTSSHPRVVGGIVGNSDIGQYVIDGCVNLGVICDQRDGFVRGPIAGGPKATVTNCSYMAGTFTGTAANGAGTEVDGNGALRAAEATDVLVRKGAMVTLMNNVKENFLAERYEAKTWVVLERAMAYAEEIDAIPVFTVTDGVIEFGDLENIQKQADKAYDDLQRAVKGLSLSAASIDDLDKAIAAADKFCADNADKVYTTASWNKFVAALTAVKAIRHDPSNPGDFVKAIEALDAAREALVLGGDIVTGSDFAMLNGQTGIFYLKGDITINAPVASFKGVLYGNGYTITLNGCALFGELDGATVYDLKVVGNAGGADSLFGAAKGKVALTNVEAATTALGVATFFATAAEGAEIGLYDVITTSDAGVAALVGNVNCTVFAINALAMADAPELVGSINADSSAIEVAYLDGKIFVDAEGNEIGDAAVFASGEVAYVINTEFGRFLLGQVIGDDACPVLEDATIDGVNVVEAVIDEQGNITGYVNAGHKYIDGDFVPPVKPEPETPVAPDYTKLNEAIAAAAVLYADDYTADSWAIVASLLASARAAQKAMDQSTVNIAADSLTAAIAALVEKTENVVKVDYTKLDAAIAKAEALYEHDYSAGTWGALQAMLAYAKIARTATTQAEVDQAVAGIESALLTLNAPAAEIPEDNKPQSSGVAASSGCGSVIGGAAVVLTAVIALGTGIAFKKKED